MIKKFINYSNLNIATMIMGVSLFLASPLTYGSDFHSPRIAALGGAGHAGPLLNDSIYLNPSYASFLPTYALGLNYLTFKGTTDDAGVPDFKGRNYNVSVQDGRSELFQAGIAYAQREDGNSVHIGASKAVIKQLGFGLGAKFFFGGKGYDTARDTTFSVTGVPFQWLQTALIIDNIFQPKEILAHGLHREFILGTKFNVKDLVLVYFDPHVVSGLESSYGHELGLEFPIMSDFFLRMGGFKNALVPYENTYGRGYSLGLGWVAPRLSLDYAIERVLDPRASTAHVFGATAYF